MQKSPRKTGKVRMTNSFNASLPNIGTLDARDRQILVLLLAGEDNKGIAAKLHIPMSTVQRRTRRLFEAEIVENRVVLNFKRLGYRSGLLHLYLKNGNMQEIAKRVAAIRGVQSTSIHVGNSDVVSVFVFKETQQLLDVMSETKKIEGVDRVVWSEEVLDIPNGADKQAEVL